MTTMTTERMENVDDDDDEDDDGDGDNDRLACDDQIYVGRRGPPAPHAALSSPSGQVSSANANAPKQATSLHQRADVRAFVLGRGWRDAGAIRIVVIGGEFDAK
jgi:hypothetical protein